MVEVVVTRALWRICRYGSVLGEPAETLEGLSVVQAGVPKSGVVVLPVICGRSVMETKGSRDG